MDNDHYLFSYKRLQMFFYFVLFYYSLQEPFCYGQSYREKILKLFGIIEFCYNDAIADGDVSKGNSIPVLIAGFHIKRAFFLLLKCDLPAVSRLSNLQLVTQGRWNSIDIYTDTFNNKIQP
jgi:hypothetical protein